MPRMLSTDEEEGNQQASDLVAFLQTLIATRPDTQALDSESTSEIASQVKEGVELFERRGCISCHHFEPPDWQDPHERISLYFVAAKQSQIALLRFLRDPHQFRSIGSRMPDMQLDESEASALATFLRTKAKGNFPADSRPDGDPERGARLFAEIGCVQCHSIRQLWQESPPPKIRSIFGGADPLPGRERGCLAPSEKRPANVPDYQWNPEQRTALQSLLATNGDAVVRETPAQYVTEAMRWLRCTACHDRDNTMAAWPEILAEEGSLGHFPEPIPPLTWSGEKLRGDWTKQLISGNLSSRTRPWLEARMPVFSEYAVGISRGLASQHGMRSEPSEPSSGAESLGLEPSEMELATRLLASGGLDCRQCHAPSSEILDNKNQAQGVGLSYMRERLRSGFYERWMRNPLRIDPGTKMPQFTLDGRTTQARHLAGGDAKRQFEAIWNYLGSEAFRKELESSAHAEPGDK